MKLEAHSPDDWVARVPGAGSCFHQALDRWLQVRAREPGWSIAIGVVSANPWSPHRHIHAWLQRGEEIVSAVNARRYTRADYFSFVGIEAYTVRLVSPRRILRASRGAINNAIVEQLLDLWGAGKWTEENGGIVPAPSTSNPGKTTTRGTNPSGR